MQLHLPYNRATAPLLRRLEFRAANRQELAELALLVGQESVAQAVTVGPQAVAELAANAVATNFGFGWDVSWMNRTPTKVRLPRRIIRGFVHHGTGSPKGASIDGACSWCLRVATGASFDIGIPRGLYKGQNVLIKYVNWDLGWASRHAGRSSWRGLADNAVSDAYLGIETDNNNRGEPITAHQREKLIQLMLWGDAVMGIAMTPENNPTHFRVAPRRKQDIPVAGYDVFGLLEDARARKSPPPVQPRLTPGNYVVTGNGTAVRSEPSTRRGAATVKRRLNTGARVTVRRSVPDLTGQVISGWKEWGEIGPNEYISGSLLRKLQPTTRSINMFSMALTQANQRFRAAPAEEHLCFDNHGDIS